MRVPIGERFGKFIVLSIGRRASKYRHVIAKCDCGTIKVVALQSIKSTGRNRTFSCGCHRQEIKPTFKHGHKSGSRESRTYKSWRAMLDRCAKTSNVAYARYGGKGVSVCDRWHDFSYFLEDMGERPEGMTLDRIDGDKGYAPENCRWASRFTQARNRSNNLMITIGESTKALAEWADTYRISYAAALQRFHRGWSIDRVFNEPVKSKNRPEKQESTT